MRKEERTTNSKNVGLPSPLEFFEVCLVKAKGKKNIAQIKYKGNEGELATRINRSGKSVPT